MSNETRKLPTRPGWWWVKWPIGSDVRPEVAEVFDDMMATSAGWGHEVPVAEVDWLAPIPGPAVCAALAKYGVAVMQRGPMQARGVSVSGALLALEDAIRAERGGGA